MVTHRPAKPLRSVAVIATSAHSLHNFRGGLIRRLAAKGIKVWALAPNHNEHSRATLTAIGAEPLDFELDRTGTQPLRDFGSMLKLSRLLRELRPDATFAYFAKGVIYGTLAARLAGVRRRVVMVDGLGYVFSDGGPEDARRRRSLQRVMLTLYRLAFAAAHKVLLSNPDDLAELVGRGVLSRRKAIMFGAVGVDLDQFAVAPLPPSETVTFLNMPRLIREKGVLDYAEAARIVRRSAPNARFILLGVPETSPSAIDPRLVDGWVEEGILESPDKGSVREWIAASHVFVLPSYYREGVPRSTQEAMAMGRPVITTDSVGCRETADDGVNGFLVPVRDPQALADAMLKFIRSPELIARMGRESRRLAEERFDAERINARLDAILHGSDA